MKTRKIDKLSDICVKKQIRILKHDKNNINEEILAEIQIPVDNILPFEKYCLIYLDPFIDRSNYTFYQCRIDKIKDVFNKCNVNINDEILTLLNNRDKTEIVLIDVPSSEQKGGSRLSPEEFNKKIVVMEGGGFILPNGAIVYPNGKVVCPDDNQVGGYVSGIPLSKEINHQRKKIYKSLNNI